MPDYRPFLIAWNLTSRCNLYCDHCYLSAGERGSGAANELATADCFRVIDELCGVSPGAILVLTGGEPLLRTDLPQIAQYATRRGLMVVVGTNGTLLTDSRVRFLQRAGVTGVSISVDSLDPERHDRFRGRPGALAGALAGIDACRRNGLAFQVHTTASTLNLDEIPELIAFSARHEARVFNLFFLVCTGRGEGMTDITPQQYEQLLVELIAVQERYPGMLIRARCAPHFKRVAHEQAPDRPLTKAHGYLAGGCLAGTHYVRIMPDGELTPCPFLPIPLGNLRTDAFAPLWQDHPVLQDLRRPQLKGRCGECEYTELCGGCRARPFAHDGDYLGEDQWCLYQPRGGARIGAAAEQGLSLIWTAEARARLQRIPLFLRSMIGARIEDKARADGLRVVTLGLMDRLRQESFGGARPLFTDGRFDGLGRDDPG